MLFQMSFLSVIRVLTAVQGWWLFNDRGFLLLCWRKRPYPLWGRALQYEYIFSQSVSPATANAAAVWIFFFFFPHLSGFISTNTTSAFVACSHIRRYEKCGKSILLIPESPRGPAAAIKREMYYFKGPFMIASVLQEVFKWAKKYAEIDKSRQECSQCWLLRSIPEIILKY